MFLEQEIAEQPSTLSTLLAEQWGAVVQIAQVIRDFDPQFISIAARGTSDNAARYAQYLFGIQAQLPVALATPSIHTLYERKPRLGRALVIGISQSGRAEDVRQVLQDAREQGALTLAITNYADSPMAQTAAHHIPLMAGEEQSIAATKTYTAQLLAIAMLGAAYTGDIAMQADLQQLPSWVKQTLKHSDHVREWAERYRYMERLVVLGRGYNYCTSFEIALKIKELCYIASENYSEADFRHGPIAIISAGYPSIIVAPQGQVYANMLDLVEKLQEKQAETLIISDNTDLLARGTKAMPIPSVPEWLSPLVCVLPGQVFAMEQARIRGYAVDKPRGLSKVTVTR